MSVRSSRTGLKPCPYAEKPLSVRGDSYDSTNNSGYMGLIRIIHQTGPSKGLSALWMGDQIPPPGGSEFGCG